VRNSRTTVSGPAEPDASGSGDVTAEQAAATQAVSSAFTFNPNKAAEYDPDAALAPPEGASVKPSDPIAGASTVSELNGSDKVGSGGPNIGQNPTVGPLDRVRVDSTERALTTNQGVPVGDNPDNFFAETEQVAFCVAHVVPGIDFSNDPVLAGRIHSYVDTQISRLGGPNFHEIPINAPIAQVHNNQRDGMHRQAIHPGRVSYEPNSLGGGCPFQAGAKGSSRFSNLARPAITRFGARRSALPSTTRKPRCSGTARLTWKSSTSSMPSASNCLACKPRPCVIGWCPACSTSRASWPSPWPPAVLYDALVLSNGADAVKALRADGRTLEFIKDQYRHCKSIPALGESAELLQACGIDPTLPNAQADPGVLVASDAVSVTDDFVAAIAKHRHFARETDPPRV
jgi:hypothetical protein